MLVVARCNLAEIPDEGNDDDEGGAGHPQEEEGNDDLREECKDRISHWTIVALLQAWC